MYICCNLLYVAHFPCLISKHQISYLPKPFRLLIRSNCTSHSLKYIIMLFNVFRRFNSVEVKKWTWRFIFNVFFSLNFTGFYISLPCVCVCVCIHICKSNACTWNVNDNCKQKSDQNVMFHQNVRHAKFFVALNWNASQKFL